MKITIDNKEINVTDPNKNIVEVADENGISIIAPCFRNKRKKGCCNACVIEVNGQEKYACGTKPEDGMTIVYHREDLDAKRKELLDKYVNDIKTKGSASSTCCATDMEDGAAGGSCCDSGSSCCDSGSPCC